jgi:4'-phosphopantetheinyl transferase EntD
MTNELPSDLVLCCARDGAAARRALRPAEQLECATRATAAAQSGYRASRLAAKQALAAAAARAADTRPARPLSLTLSHSADRGAAVVAPHGVRVGVDLERCGSIPPAVERFFLTPRERDELDAHDATSLWCLKEAAWKAFDCTPALPLHELELQFEAGAVVGVKVAGTVHAAGSSLFTPWRGWIGAVVWREPAQ